MIAMQPAPERTTIRYISPDQGLTFLVVRERDDVSLGFAGYPWHTHADVLSGLSELSEEDAVSRYVDALLNNESVIAVLTLNNIVIDIWIADDPLTPEDFKTQWSPQEGEAITFR